MYSSLSVSDTPLNSPPPATDPHSLALPQTIPNSRLHPYPPSPTAPHSTAPFPELLLFEFLQPTSHSVSPHCSLRSRNWPAPPQTRWILPDPPSPTLSSGHPLLGPAAPPSATAEIFLCLDSR